MGRLIDADRLYNIIKDEVKSAKKIGYTEEQEKWINQDMDLFMGLISEQPTAFDVDKVADAIRKYCIQVVNDGKDHVEVTKFNFDLQNILEAGGVDEGD